MPLTLLGIAILHQLQEDGYQSLHTYHGHVNQLIIDRTTNWPPWIANVYSTLFFTLCHTSFAWHAELFRGIPFYAPYSGLQKHDRIIESLANENTLNSNRNTGRY